jgi:hypothetical protein
LNRKAAAKLSVSNHQIHRLIKEGPLAAEQAVFDATWKIRASDLKAERLIAALARNGRPCPAISKTSDRLSFSFI